MLRPESQNTLRSAPSWYSATALWRTLRKVVGVASEKTLLTALTLFYCLLDKDTPTWAKSIIVGALGYFILPLDMVPDFIPGVGYGDDWGAIVGALGTVTIYIKSAHREKAAAQVARLLFSKKYR